MLYGFEFFLSLPVGSCEGVGIRQGGDCTFEITFFDLQVLMVLWAKKKPMTRKEIADCIPDRHENNVRRSCARLIKLGYLESAEIGRERGNKIRPVYGKEAFIMRHIMRLRPNVPKLITMLERVRERVGKDNR